MVVRDVQVVDRLNFNVEFDGKTLGRPGQAWVLPGLIHKVLPVLRCAKLARWLGPVVGLEHDALLQIACV